MEKIKSKIYQFTIFLVLSSIVFSLINLEKQKEFFYIAIYASILGLIIGKNQIKFETFSVAYPVFLIGMLNIVWYFIYENQFTGMNVHNNYFNSSKKLILASLLLFYIDKFKFYISVENFKKYFFIAATTGFILATGYALWQHSQGIVRIEMSINRATISAYVYSVLSFTFIYSLNFLERERYYSLLGVIIPISWNVILYTGTRSAIILYLLFSFVKILFYFRKVRIKYVLFFLCFISQILFISYKPIISLKIIQTKNEIEEYKKGQDNTSLGSRISMWKLGIENGLSHPFGQSIKSRETWSHQYIKNGHQYLASSLIYINIHLHNEFIEKYSLQGIPGILILFFFFVSIFYFSLKKKNELLFTAMFFLFLYGLTDVILLSSEAILFFTTILGLTSFFMK